MPYIDPSLIEAVEKANQKYSQANANMLDIWMDKIVFSWQWWINVVLTILPWVIWFIVRDKKNTPRLLYAGLASIIMSCYLDMTGMALGLWGYYIKVVPAIPPYMPWDFTVIPVAIMLMCQFARNINPVIKAAVFAALGALVALPLSLWLGFIYLVSWQVYFSFPVLMGLYLAGYYFFSRPGVKT